jgi:endonuclease/exonuclease/phosphatase family metal-dependent hydrolase
VSVEMPLTLATFNVKNLLAPRDERERAVLGEKLDWIGRMLRACDADVIALQEAGPPELVGAVVDRLGRSAGWGEPVLGTADARGIRCALLSRLPLLEARVQTADALDFPTFVRGDPPPFGRRIPLRRGVVHARVDAPQIGAIDVLVAHFKSARPVPLKDPSGADIEPASARERAEGAQRSLVWRGAEALYVRGLVDDELRAREGAHVVVAGDLNDVAASPVVRTVRGEGAGALLDCTAGIDPAARYSVLHEGRPSQIDHALATAGLYARLRDARFLNEGLRDHASPVTPSGAIDEAPSVDSDHAPLVVRFG